MADEYDYTSLWSSTFSIPPIDGGGVYIRDDGESIGLRDAEPISDPALRLQYEEAHPRAHPGGQRGPDPMGAGRQSDRVGPSQAERRAAAALRDDRAWADSRETSAAFRDDQTWADPREAFTPGPADRRAKYVRGDTDVGYPGFRGLSSSREGRPAIDEAMWDPRPPHFNPNAGNREGHLYIEPRADAPRFWGLPEAGWPRSEGFGGPKKGGFSGDPIEIHPLWVVLLVIVVVLVAMYTMLRQFEKRIAATFREIIAEALSIGPKA